MSEESVICPDYRYIVTLVNDPIDLARDGHLTRKPPIQMLDFQRMFEANFDRLRTYFSKEEYDRSKRWRNLPINLPKQPNS
jgi:hypothetical protein